MEINQFKKFQKQIKSQLNWDEESMLDMEKKLGKFYQELLDVQFVERKEYEDLVSKQKAKYGEVYHKVKYLNDFNYESKNEIDTQVHCDEDYMKLCYRLNQQGAIIEYIEGTLKNITGVPYQIRDYQKWVFYKNGVTF